MSPRVGRGQCRTHNNKRINLFELITPVLVRVNAIFIRPLNPGCDPTMPIFTTEASETVVYALGCCLTHDSHHIPATQAAEADDSAAAVHVESVSARKLLQDRIQKTIRRGLYPQINHIQTPYDPCPMTPRIPKSPTICTSITVTKLHSPTSAVYMRLTAPPSLRRCP